MDYCFLRHGASEASATVLVMKERRSRVLMANVVQAKGRGLGETVDQVVANVHRLGCQTGMILKTDNEPALLDLRRAVSARLGIWAVPEVSPAYEPQANGVVEMG